MVDLHEEDLRVRDLEKRISEERDQVEPERDQQADIIRLKEELAAK